MIDAGHELDTIGCASATLCVAWSHGSGQGHILTATNPAGGAGAWESWSPNIGSTMEAITCPSSSLCVASGGGGIYTSTNPASGGGNLAGGSVADFLFRLGVRRFLPHGDVLRRG